MAGELELLGTTSGRGSQPPGARGSGSRPQPVFQAAERNCGSMPGSLAARTASAGPRGPALFSGPSQARARTLGISCSPARAAFAFRRNLPQASGAGAELPASAPRPGRDCWEGDCWEGPWQHGQHPLDPTGPGPGAWPPPRHSILCTSPGAQGGKGRVRHCGLRAGCSQGLGPRVPFTSALGPGQVTPPVPL